MNLPDTADIALLPNLGSKSGRMLRAAHVNTVGDLRKIGAIEAFVRVKFLGEQPSLNLLWSLVAGLRSEHWTSLSEDEKRQLKTQLRDG